MKSHRPYVEPSRTSLLVVMVVCIVIAILLLVLLIGPAKAQKRLSPAEAKDHIW